MFLNPTVSGVPDNCQQPGSRINTAESGEIFQCASIGFLHYILRILVAFNYPACKIIGRIQMMEKKLFETRQLLSHSNKRPLAAEFIPRICLIWTIIVSSALNRSHLCLDQRFAAIVGN